MRGKSEPIINNQRKCTYCKKIKLISEFCQYKKKPFGILPFCKECRHIKEKKWNFKSREKGKRNEYQKQQRQKLRKIVLEHYSGNQPTCACCGENHIEFLCIDHINGGGNKHFRQIGMANFYYWLRRNNFPLGYRVLCHNCNISLGNYGYCPHKNNISKL